MTTLNDFAKGFYTLLILTPLFWIIPTLVEGLQHYVEVQLGMFTVGDSVEAGKETVIRLAFGFLKVLSIIIPSMLILKLAAQGWDKRNIFPLTTFEKLSLLILALLVLASLIFVTYYVPNNSAFLIGQFEIPSELAPFIPVFILLVPMLIFRNQLLKGFLNFAALALKESFLLSPTFSNCFTSFSLRSCWQDLWYFTTNSIVGRLALKAKNSSPY